MQVVIKTTINLQGLMPPNDLLLTASHEIITV